jgi:hypothetical protein
LKRDVGGTGVDVGGTRVDVGAAGVALADELELGEDVPQPDATMTSIRLVTITGGTRVRI